MAGIIQLSNHEVAPSVGMISLTLRPSPCSCVIVTPPKDMPAMTSLFMNMFASSPAVVQYLRMFGFCAISQAATSMLTELVIGKSATEVAQLPKETLLDEIGIPLTPARLKCALLGLGVLKVALHRAKGTPLPKEWAGLDDLGLR